VSVFKFCATFDQCEPVRSEDGLLLPTIGFVVDEGHCRSGSKVSLPGGVWQGVAERLECLSKTLNVRNFKEVFVFLGFQKRLEVAVKAVPQHSDALARQHPIIEGQGALLEKTLLSDDLTVLTLKCLVEILKFIKKKYGIVCSVKSEDRSTRECKVSPNKLAQSFYP